MRLSDPLSPDFGPMGCLGAVLWVVLFAGAMLGLVLMAWSCR